ncbi:MAG: polyphenol oxidase family protein [Treponema sp.]|jgi:YfiH family protein|nr:polyphenol oxidase family protein [Treponema sp.]
MRIYPFKLFFSGIYGEFPFFFDGFKVKGISCVISFRAAGDMAYAAGELPPARRELYKTLALDPVRVYGLTQVHSREVLVLDRHSPHDRPRVDGLLSRDRGIWLSVTVADCLPVYLLDTESGAFGILHSGWKGTGIVLSALALMRERWNTRARAVAAVLGPCIGPCCYRVDEDRARAFAGEFGGAGGTYPLGPVVIRRPREGSGPAEPFLDLRAANARLLAGAGVQNLVVCQDCTVTDDRLGSFRREGKDYTRMVALIGFREPAGDREGPV